MPGQNRIQKLRSSFKAQGVGAVLVTSPADFRYLTGYAIKETWLLVTSRTAACLTDGRYVEEVKRYLPDLTPVECHRSIVQGAATACRELGVRCLGLDERHMTAAEYRKLRSLCGKKITLKPVNGMVDALRMIKEPDEIRYMRQALRLNLKAYRYIKSYLKAGVSEWELLHRLEGFIRKHDTAFAFDPIIASGPNSAYPHAQVTSRKLCRKEFVLIDLGMDYKGYKSDLTRMFFLDKMPASYRDVLSIVRDAQHEAFKVIRPGISGREVFEASWGYLKKHGLAERFTHALGHGVGLEVHEAPRLSHTSTDILKENMVCTVEPGVYFPGQYGIRLEEMVLVTEKGCTVLSDTTGV